MQYPKLLVVMKSSIYFALWRKSAFQLLSNFRVPLILALWWWEMIIFPHSPDHRQLLHIYTSLLSAVSHTLRIDFFPRLNTFCAASPGRETSFLCSGFHLPVPLHPTWDRLTRTAQRTKHTCHMLEPWRNSLPCTTPFLVIRFCLMKLHFYTLLGCVPAWCEMTTFFSVVFPSPRLSPISCPLGMAFWERNELATMEESLVLALKPPPLLISSERERCCSGKSLWEKAGCTTAEWLH